MNAAHDAALQVLGDHSTLTLATCGHKGPWASSVFFAEEVRDGEIVLYFATLRPSRKWRHLLGNTKVAFAMGDEGPVRWLQGSGDAERIEGDERSRAEGLLRSKAPGFDRFISAVQADFFLLVPREIRVVDLSEGLPQIFWMRK